MILFYAWRLFILFYVDEFEFLGCSHSICILWKLSGYILSIFCIAVFHNHKLYTIHFLACSKKENSCKLLRQDWENWHCIPLIHRVLQYSRTDFVIFTVKLVCLLFCSLKDCHACCIIVECPRPHHLSLRLSFIC